MAYIFPEKIFATTLNKYIQCPFKFKCHNDTEVKEKFVASPESFVGTVMHLVLKDFFDIKKTPIKERKDQDLGEMLRYFWARVPKNGWSKEYWSSEERVELFGSKEQEKAFGLQAMAMLNNYISGSDLSVIPLALEDWMDCEIGDFRIAGCIDRIDQDSDSLISVWDYKTGKLPFYKDIEKIIEEDVQIPIYAIIASKLHPFAKKIRAGLIYVKYSRIFDKTWDKEELKELEGKLVNIIKTVKDDNTLLPKINKLCPWCEYKDICPSKDKIAERYTRIEEVNW